MKATIHIGNCIDVMKAMPESSIDAVVCDPPYGLEFMGKDWDAPWKTDRRQTFDGTLKDERENPYARSKVRYGIGDSYGGGKRTGFGEADGSKFRQNRGTPNYATSGNPTCLNCGGDKYRNGDRKCSCDAPVFQNHQLTQMGVLQEWYYTWAVEALRVLKPGGHLLAFGGSRTYHRLACAIEDAGFEIRDQIQWIYGCLDEHTELVSQNGVKQYHKASIGERVLCYDPENGKYSYQPILEIVEYDYSDTAYRLIGDFGEQVVSRNHRCIVERDGSEVLQLAETLRSEARVPVLESLSELQKALSNLQSYPSKTEPILQSSLCSFADWESQQYSDTTREKKGASCSVRGLREGEVGAAVVAEKDQDLGMQLRVQRSAPRRGVETARAQGTATLEAGIGICLEDSDDRPDESSMEGGLDLPEAQGSLRRPANQVRSLFAAVPEHGSEGRLCDGTPSTGRSSDWQAAPESRSSTSQEPQSDGESTYQPNAVRDKWGAQGIRAWRGHKTTVVRVVPFHYTGKMWCLRVPTGAFVAVRGGVAFPTGNSGFPKSLDVSKAIDKAAGAEREVTGKRKHPTLRDTSLTEESANAAHGENTWSREWDITSPATDAAKRFSGWGTALKPSHEPVVVARKPLRGTVAANVLKWGTGAINVDGCRIPINTEVDDPRLGGKGDWSSDKMAKNVYEGGYAGERVGSSPLGRWPANVILDGSEEVVSLFPENTSTIRSGDDTGEHLDPSTENWRFRRVQGGFDDSGSAARFFYCPKVGREERDMGCEEMTAMRCGMMEDDNYPIKTGSGNLRDTVRKNNHPTVKPVDLMAYLCRLVTPPGGVVLDPFLGSGSTGIAALRENFDFIGVEISPDYATIAEKRIKGSLPWFQADAVTVVGRIEEPIPAEEGSLFA